MEKMFIRGFILLIFFIWTLCVGVFLIKPTKFDKSYKVINRERSLKYENKNEKIYYYFLHCTNDLGNFKIDVDKSTYDSKPYGSMVRFKEPFSSFEMYSYAENKKTENNIVEALSDKTEKFLVKNQFVGIFMVIGCIICPIFFFVLLFKVLRPD